MVKNRCLVLYSVVIYSGTLGQSITNYAGPLFDSGPLGSLKSYVGSRLSLVGLRDEIGGCWFWVYCGDPGPITPKY